MKTLTLNLKKKIYILEINDNQHLENIIACNNQGIRFCTDDEQPTKLICKGSELTEDMSKEYVEGMYSDFYLTQTNISQLYKSSLATYIGSALKAFKERIKIQGYYWGENPIEKPHNSGLVHFYPTGDYLMDKSLEIAQFWQEGESKTFNPEKTLIFEIL